MKTFTELNWGFLEIFFLFLIALGGLCITYYLMPYIINYMAKKGYTGIDIHKNSKPEVAESGGAGIMVGGLIISLLLMLFFPAFLQDILIIILTILLAGLIGYIDDRIKLRSRYKIGLTLFIGLLIFIANYFKVIRIDDPTMPILGQMRLTILFPILIPIIIAVFANTVNMLEGYNGEGSGTCLIALAFLIVCSVIRNSADGFLYSVIFFFVILGFYFYNKYPAKAFPGDIGTLTMGVMIAVVALFGNLLFPAFCALLLHVFNSFLYLSSVRGFFESTEIHRKRDDIMLLQDNRIKASEKKNALMTLPRLVLAKEPLKEPELVKYFYVLSGFCGILAIFATLLTSYTPKSINLLLLIIWGVILLFPLIILFYFFRKVIGIALLLFIVYILLFFLLYIIDLIILPYIPGLIDLKVIAIPINMLISGLLVVPILIIWYVLTKYYFWTIIGKKNLRNTKKSTVQ